MSKEKFAHLTADDPVGYQLMRAHEELVSVEILVVLTTGDVITQPLEAIKQQPTFDAIALSTVVLHQFHSFIERHLSLHQL